MRAIDDPAAIGLMTGHQRDTLRESADTLVLSRTSNHDTRLALAAAHTVLVELRGTDCEAWIEQLANDIELAGPGIFEPLVAAGAAGSHWASTYR